MKKVIIAGSAKLQEQVDNWVKYFNSRNCEVLDYPRNIEKSRFMELYPNVHIDFLKKIIQADMFF